MHFRPGREAKPELRTLDAYVRGTVRVEADVTYAAELPTTGLTAGQHTAVAVGGSGHYAETTFTPAAAVGGDPDGTPGAATAAAESGPVGAVPRIGTAITLDQFLVLSLLLTGAAALCLAGGRPPNC